MANYPKKLYFLIVNVCPEDFEFDANIRDNQIVPGTYIKDGDEEYEDEDGEMRPYANYDVRRIKNYPLMVEEDCIDDFDVPYFTHTSFGYYICSTKEKAQELLANIKSL